MYRILKRPVLAAALGTSISVPAYYYSIMKQPLSDNQTLASSAQESISPPSTTHIQIPTKIPEDQHQQAAMGSTSPQPTAQLSKPYTATFSVPMHCSSCTESITAALSPLSGIQNTTFTLAREILTVTGTAAPSVIIAAIEATGRTAILRGSGKPNSAAVCILETPLAPSSSSSSKNEPINQTTKMKIPVRGLARLIELDDSLTMLDLILTGLAPGRWQASVRATGDISRGLQSVGPVWRGFAGDRDGVVGEVDVEQDGRAGLVGEMHGWRVWELVGRGVVVERVRDDDSGDGDGEGEGDDEASSSSVVMGVVARSAGAWENAKVVCACSGKTVWEEREGMVARGMA